MGDPKWENLRGSGLYREVVSVRVSGPLLDTLVDEGLFGLNEQDEVNSVSPAVEAEKARRVILILRHKPDSFDRFCLVLKKVGYEELAEKMRSIGYSASLVDSGALPTCDERVDSVASKSVSVGAVSEQLGQRSEASGVLTDVSVVGTGGHGPSVREMAVFNSQLQASSPWSILTKTDVIIDLCTDLGFDSNFLTGLQEAKIINFEQLKILNDGQNPREFKLKFLLNKILPLCSSNQFLRFCEVLEKTNRNQLSAELMKIASRMECSASERLSRSKAGQLPLVMAKHTTEGDIEDANTDVESDDERTEFVKVSNLRYKKIHSGVEYMIKETIHSKDKTLKIEVTIPKGNPCDMEKEWQSVGGTAVKLTSPAVSYEKRSENKKVLLVHLLSRNIVLSMDEIRFVGGYPDGLAYVISTPKDRALHLFCLLKDPLPEWPFDSFGPVESKFHGLQSNIEMKFDTSSHSASLVDSGALPIYDERVDSVASESVSVSAGSEQLAQRSQASEEVLTDISVVETGGHGPSIREMAVSNSQLQASSPWSILTEPDIVIEFCTHLGLNSNFLSGLQEAKIINSEEYLEILNDGQKPRKFKLKLLLKKILPLCSSNQFFMFCEILKKTNRNQLSAELMKRASRIGWSASERLSRNEAGQPLPLVMAKHATEGDIEDANTDVESDDERTEFVKVISNFRYKKICNEVESMIEETIHSKNKTLKLEVINPCDMEEEWQYDGPQSVGRTAVKFTFSAVPYGKRSENKKVLLVRLLSRNIIALSKDEIGFVGGYPNGLACVISTLKDRALHLFCLLKNPLPEWPFDSFGPVEIKFHGLQSYIEMKFDTSRFVSKVYQSNQNMTARSMKLKCSLLMLKQRLDKCFKDVGHVDKVLRLRKQELNLFQANVRDYKGMNELKCKSLNEVVKSHLNVIVMKKIDPVVIVYVRIKLKLLDTSLQVCSLYDMSQHFAGVQQSLKKCQSCQFQLEAAHRRCHDLLESVENRRVVLMPLKKELSRIAVLTHLEKEQSDKESSPLGGLERYHGNSQEQLSEGWCSVYDAGMTKYNTGLKKRPSFL